MRNISLLILLLVTTPIWAQSDIDDGEFERGRGRFGNGNERSERMRNVRLGRSRHAGNGCPEGTVSASLSPDSTTLTLLFDNYLVKAGGDSGLRRALKHCLIEVPMEAPEGYQVTVTKMDYRGYNSLPTNAHSVFQTNYRFSEMGRSRGGPNRLRRRMRFVGPIDEEYTISSFVANRPIWSRCGQSFSLQIETQVTTVTNQQSEEALTTLDSLDMSSENVQYHLHWQKCEDRDARPGRGQRGRAESQ